MNTFKSVLVLIALLSVPMASCKKTKAIEHPSAPTHLLLGDWQMIEKDGYDYPAPGTSFILTFRVSGEAQSCYKDDENPLNNECDIFTWKWKENSNTSIIIMYETDEVLFDITKLNDTRLEYDITDDLITTSYKYLKVQ